MDTNLEQLLLLALMAAMMSMLGVMVFSPIRRYKTIALIVMVLLTVVLFIFF